MTLKPELIPEPLWGISAATLLGRSSAAWRGIRADALSVAKETCSACEATIPGGKYMVCDELWSYDEDSGVATLAGVRILCKPCDGARHFERARQLGRAEEALATLMRVNGISRSEARELQNAAGRDYHRRSLRIWVVQVDEGLQSRYPGLSGLVGKRGVPGEGQARMLQRDRRESLRRAVPK